MTVALSTRLRDETKGAHTRAERSGIMRALLSGKLPLDGYTALLLNLHLVYVALEQELATHASDPAVAAINDPALNRVAALESDLRTINGDGWASRPGMVDAGRAYAARIEAAASEPALLVAHSYTRYLGDLSGGQILKRFALKLLPPEQQSATAFYTFPDIADAEAYKHRYREALDGLPVDGAGADRIVAEALAAFELNAQLFEALG